MTTEATPGALGSNDQLGLLPEARKPDEHGAGWFTAGQMRAYAAQEVEAERERFVDALADACIAAEIPDSKFESLLIALRA